MIFKYLDLQGMEYLCKNHLNGDYYKGIKINSENFNELYNLILKVYKNKINHFYGIDFKAKEYLKNFLQIKDAIENARMDVSKTIYDMENKMKLDLDKRIPNKDCILTCFDTEQAKQYVDTKGYFTNDMGDFNNLDGCYDGTLNVVYDNSSRPFLNKDFSRYFGFFLPEKFVKEKQAKKKFRPCTLDEFGLHIGDLIRFRKKDNHNFEICTMYMGHIKNNGIVKVLLGNTYYSLEVLFNDYEWYDSDSHTWEMFGVEE